MQLLVQPPAPPGPQTALERIWLAGDRSQITCGRAVCRLVQAVPSKERLQNKCNIYGTPGKPSATDPQDAAPGGGAERKQEGFFLSNC